MNSERLESVNKIDKNLRYLRELKYAVCNPQIPITDESYISTESLDAEIDKGLRKVMVEYIDRKIEELSKEMESL